MLVAAAVLAVIAWRMLKGDRDNVRLAAASGAWPTTRGHVQTSQVVQHVSTRRDSDTNQDIEQITYAPTVSYSYDVGGKSFAGSRLSFKVPHYISETKANNAIAKFPAGSDVDVAYDPADPNTSVLDRDTKPSAVSLWTGIIGVMAVAVAGLGVTMFLI